VHDSKSRERSTRALRSRMTTAVVLLVSGAVVDGQIIGGFRLSLRVVSNRPDKFVIPWRRPTHHEGYVWRSSL